MTITKMLKLLCAGTILAASVLPAMAGPPDAGDVDMDDILARTAAVQEKMLDDFHASYGPIRYPAETARAYVRMDERFGELMDRMAVYFLADPAQQQAYRDAVAKGRFEGSAEDHARYRALAWLMEPRYGYNAQIYSPPNIPNADALMEVWRAASTRGPLASDAPCTNRWTDRASVPELAADFERAVNTYMGWYFADADIYTAFNMDGQQFIDRASESAYVRDQVARWLASADATLQYPETCVFTVTNFDAWSVWDAQYGAQREPFSGGLAPK
ncbi:MAG: hypothetical protein IPK75_00775 [Acidobacteria bacterium]|nr:hypothetical protein [Acidobacteriota bacterium]